MTKKENAQEILKILKKTYRRKKGDFAEWKNPLELLVATILSAQCTDKRVNMVTKKLFKKYKTADDYACARLEDLEKEVYSTGFYKNKAKHLKGLGNILREKYNGNVPNNFEALLTLPGVARKTANLVMSKAFGKHVGIAVDTHVERLAQRMGLTKKTNPNAIADDLEQLFDSKDWLDVNEFFILHGRALCKAKPLCILCPVKNMCSTGAWLLQKKKQT